MKINSLLDKEKTAEVLYHMYLTRINKFESASVYIDLKKSELRIGGDSIIVRFRCTSIFDAENLIDMILEPNDLVVAPVNLIEK
jgi:hypothetical protein